MCYSLTLSTVSSFFAQVIGFYLVLKYLSILLQPERFKKIMTNILGHPASLFLCSTMSIIFALVIITPHNIWVASWPLLITLIGWLALVKGVLSLFFPEKFAKMAAHVMKKHTFQVWTWVWLLIGLYLVWMGIYQNMYM